MQVRELHDLPIGFRLDCLKGFVLAVKTCKKKWQVGEDWMHQVVLTDQSGDILADVNIIKNIPIVRNRQLIILDGEIQPGGVGGKKLYIDKFQRPSTCEPPDTMSYSEDFRNSIKGKVRTWLVASLFQSGKDVEIVRQQIAKPEFEKIIDYIMGDEV